MRQIRGIIVILILISATNADYHYPFCSSVNHTKQSNCFEYAMAYVFGGSPCCTDTYLGNEASGISSSWFDHYDWNITTVAVGDIIYWGDHAVVVTVIDGRTKYEDIDVIHKKGPSGGVESETLQDVIDGPIVKGSDPTNYARLDNNWGFTLQNDFPGTSTMDGQVQRGQSYYASGYQFSTFHWGSSHTLTANYHLNTYDGEQWMLDEWLVGTNFYDSDSVTSVTITHKYTEPTYTASYEIYYEVTITTEFPTLIDYKVGTSTVDAPHQYNIAKNNSIIVEAIDDVTNNNLEYRFDAWQEGETVKSTNKTWTCVATKNATYTANYTRVPTQVQNVDEDGGLGDPMHLTWDQHANSSVSYNIYRKVQNLSTHTMSKAQKIAVISHGTTEYTDNDYEHVRGSTHIVYYDVRAYYSSDESEADSNFIQAPGALAEKQDANNSKPTEIPQSFSLDAYPNPFNPIVNIKYSIPKEGPIEIEIYNILGESVATLVDNYHAPGEYTVSWNVEDVDGSALPGGLYLYVVNTPTKRVTGKITYMK